MTDTLRRERGVGENPQKTAPARNFPIAAVVRSHGKQSERRVSGRRSLSGRELSPSRHLSRILSVLAMVAAANAAGAAAPVVNNIIGSPAIVAPGGLVTLEVSAHDPDCSATCLTGCGLYIRPDLTAWSADGGAFVFVDSGAPGSPYTATAQWQAPSTEGAFTLSVSLSDSGGMMCGGRQTATASLQVVVTSTPGSPPVIESLVGDPMALYPGEESQLACAAHDPDGDPVSYSWSSDLGGLTPGANGSAVFAATSPGVAAITCTVTDAAGAAASRSIELAVSDVAAQQLLTPGLSSPHRVDVDSMGERGASRQSAWRPVT
jgi:hypothetical protein